MLNERYKLLRPLGQGSQAFVWVAEHLALGSQVAVKLIDPELAKQEDARQRFAREALAAAKLRSAHVVQMLDHGIEGEQPFIVMELLDGEDLFDRLDRRKKLTLPETSRIVTQVSRALMRAHAEGIIHRDLKPENVFLVRNEDDELAKVLDFGVAKIVTPAKQVMVRTGVGTLIGTPHYMSPEQVKGVTDIDHRSDLWSLGVIAYQSLTGQLPFDSEGVGDLLIRITLNEPLKPSTVVPDLPHEFDMWFAKACAKNPDERFQTAREMAEALAKVCGILPVSSQPGQLLVNLADATDLDWGSLAGIRIPPPRKSAPTLDEIESSALSRHTRDALVQGAGAALAKDGAPRSTPIPAPPLSENPFLKPEPLSRPPSSRSGASAAASPASLAPQTTTSVGPPSSPRSAVGTTVTGLASTSIELEAEGGKRRKAIWFVGLAVVLGSVVLAAFVIRSRGGFDTGPTPNTPPVAAPQPTATHTTNPVVASVPSSSAAPSAPTSSEAVDPTVTKKPTASVTARPTPPGTGWKPRRPDEEPGAIIIELPSPDKEVPLPLKR